MPTPTLFRGAYSWRRQKPPQFALEGFPTKVHYDRFTWLEAGEGKIGTWVNSLPQDTIFGVRLQSCVPGKTSLPSNPGFQVIWDSNKAVNVPNYNDPGFLKSLEEYLKRITLIFSGKKLARVDIGWGWWDELHMYQASAATQICRPTVDTKERIFRLYQKYFDSRVLTVGTGDPEFLQVGDSLGMGLIFCDSVGLIDGQGNNFFEEKIWNDPNRRPILEKYEVVGETGSSDPARLNFEWIAESMKRHPNFVALGNGNFPAGSLSSFNRQKIIEALSTVQSRLVIDPPPPTPPVDPHLAEIEALRSQLALKDDELRSLRDQVEVLQASRTLLLSKLSQINQISTVPTT